jgi:undecaprenyl-diphosphatase
VELILAADTRLYQLINGLSGSPILDWVMLGLSSVYPWVAVGVAFVALVLWKHTRALLLLCVVLGLTIGASDFVTYQVLKPAASRPRPCYALKEFHLVTPRCGSDNGFPSNHAANAMAASVVLSGYFVRRRERWVLFVAAVLVGLSRVYLGVHYPLDVLAGFIVGGLLGLAARWFYRRFCYKSPDRSNTTLGLRDTLPSTSE